MRWSVQWNVLPGKRGFNTIEMRLNYFNFDKFEDKYLLTNDFGNHIFVSHQEFKKLLQGSLASDSSIYRLLLERGFVYEGSDLDFSSRKSMNYVRLNSI